MSKGCGNVKKIGPSKHIAELALAQVQVKIAKGEYLGIYEEKKLTFRQFAPEYLAFSQANKSGSSYVVTVSPLIAGLSPCLGIDISLTSPWQQRSGTSSSASSLSIPQPSIKRWTASRPCSTRLCAGAIYKRIP